MEFRLSFDANISEDEATDMVLGLAQFLGGALGTHVAGVVINDELEDDLEDLEEIEEDDGTLLVDEDEDEDGDAAGYPDTDNEIIATDEDDEEIPF